MMDGDSAPPAYEENTAAAKYNWKIRNARNRSDFEVHRKPEVDDYRKHLECMKDTVLGYSHSVGSPTSPVDQSQHVAVEYSQAFGDVGHLICEYQACLEKIKPLQEEDVLFLLLSRYARSTGSGVYLEIRKSSDLQVYDSELAEPHHTAGMQENLAFGSGVVNALVSMDTDAPLSINSQEENFLYEPIPQTPSLDTAECTVTINFPDMLLVNEAVPYLPPAYPTTQQQQDQQIDQDIDMRISDWGLLPKQLQPPSFRVHRCHHEGMELGGEGDESELPEGFPEAVKQICQVPDNIYHVGFYIDNRSHRSLPATEGGMQAFECHILSGDTRIYITVQRQGDRLEYNCFRDEEVWATCHDGHEECQGCVQET
ncbi:hypothetical protein T440DRAFT_559586 [Plenodomus tracheiphilus IPT5]|uniref:Uncharacterized protein n=1 Tax=Plenodomus tracheiphilus IPT5 TaxID=1408161 RepID=A0A6A7AQU3_9PLEO|nr:hypothetical protein T440DRAFT_559586 [Plenodomus tracheiphilus IPT5]